MPTDFIFFGAEHFFWLALTVVSTITLVWVSKRCSPAQQKRVALWLAWLSPLSWVVTTMFIAPMENWNLQLVLPLHLCYFLPFLMPLMLVKKQKVIFEITYFWVMAGCIQALFTPEIKYPFPHPDSFRHWFVHILLMQCYFFALSVFKMRPFLKDIWKSLLYLDLYVLIVGILNHPLGTNFLFLREKPTVPTLLDHLGEFPMWLFTGQLLALALFFLVYLPYFISDSLEKKKQNLAFEAEKAISPDSNS